MWLVLGVWFVGLSLRMFLEDDFVVQMGGDDDLIESPRTLWCLTGLRQEFRW